MIIKSILYCRTLRSRMDSRVLYIYICIYPMAGIVLQQGAAVNEYSFLRWRFIIFEFEDTKSMGTMVCGRVNPPKEKIAAGRDGRIVG